MYGDYAKGNHTADRELFVRALCFIFGAKDKLAEIQINRGNVKQNGVSRFAWNGLNVDVLSRG